MCKHNTQSRKFSWILNYDFALNPHVKYMILLGLSICSKEQKSEKSKAIAQNLLELFTK